MGDSVVIADIDSVQYMDVSPLHLEKDANILGMRGDIALSKGEFNEALQLYIEAKNTCVLTNYLS